MMGSDVSKSSKVSEGDFRGVTIETMCGCDGANLHKVQGHDSGYKVAI